MMYTCFFRILARRRHALLAALAVAAALATGGESSGALLVGALALAAGAGPDARSDATDRDADRQGAWRVLPLEGRFDLVYRDAAGNFSMRRLFAREVRVGPGKLLLGGTDARSGGYRGFRADRIERILDVESGEVAERNIVDWLIKRATPRRRPRAGVAREA